MLRLLGAVGVLALPSSAFAYDAEVAARTSAQAYELRGPNDSVVLVRRRITQTLTLGAYSLLPHRPEGPTVDAQLMLRLDTDFGVDPDESDPTKSATFVPFTEDRQIDLAYGWIDGKGFVHGWLDFRVGRQMLFDPLGLYAFDGGLVRVVTPYFLLLEAYGGFETKGSSPLGPARWGRDGIQEDDTSGYGDPSLYPSIGPEHLDPVWGVSLASHGYFPLHSRWTYRTTGARSGLGERRVGWAGDYAPIDPVIVRGQVVYDLGLEVLSEAQAGTEVEIARPVVASLDWVYFRPTFSMESIWNYFSIQPMNDGRLGLRVRPAEGLEISSTGWVRFFGDQGGSGGRGSFPWTPADAISDTGGDLQARARNTVGEATLRLSAAGGFGGERAGVEAYLMKSFSNDRWRAELFPSVWYYRDDLRALARVPSRASATSFSYVVGALYRYSKEANLHLQYEHSVNRIVGNRFRLLAVLDLRFWL